MNKITIQERCKKIESEILSMTSVKNFYIGKTDNIESARKRHNGTYDITNAIAMSDAININNAEKFAIDFFENDSRLDNERGGGAGSHEADTLYISLRFNITRIDEIYDDTITIDCYELLPIKH